VKREEEDESKNEEEDEDAVTGFPDYDYLLKMAIWSLTKEKIDKMKE